MSSERGRVALIFAAVGIALVAGLYYFFKIYQPRQVRAGAQAEIATWEERFHQARACVLGATPGSPNAGEALAIRELSPDPWSRGTCAQLIGKLSRGIAEDTGSMQVEHAWMSIDRAAAKVATAFASRVDASGDLPDKRDRSALPAALEGLDQADAELRKAAGMDPPGFATQPALPIADLIPIRDGAAAVKVLDSWQLPSAGGVIAFGATQDRQIQVTWMAGATPKVLRVPPRGVRALPDLAWGGVGLADHAVIGPLDEDGGFTRMENLAMAPPVRVVLAVGSLTDGLVAYANEGSLMFARSTGGSFAADKPQPFAHAELATDPRGRAMVVWSTADGTLQGEIVRGGATAKVTNLGSGDPRASCLTTTKGWVEGTAQLIAFDEAGATPHVLADHELVGCSDTVALLHQHETTRFAVCGDACRTAELAGVKPSAIATVVGDKVVAIQSLDRILGVWRETGAPQFFSLPTAVVPKLAISDGKVIDVLGVSTDGVVVVRVPVR